MRKVLFSLLILFVLFCGTIFGAEGDVIWMRTYNGTANGNDFGRGIAVDESGNVYVTGYEWVVGGQDNIWVRKYDSDGYEVWTSTCDGADDAGEILYPGR